MPLWHHFRCGTSLFDTSYQFICLFGRLLPVKHTKQRSLVALSPLAESKCLLLLLPQPSELVRRVAWLGSPLSHGTSKQSDGWLSDTLLSSLRLCHRKHRYTPRSQQEKWRYHVANLEAFVITSLSPFSNQLTDGDHSSAILAMGCLPASAAESLQGAVRGFSSSNTCIFS